MCVCARRHKCTAGFNDNKFEKKHFDSIGSEGVAYGCRPEFSTIVELLNEGLQKFKKTGGYKAWCDRHASVPCEFSSPSASTRARGHALCTRAHMVTGAHARARIHTHTHMLQNARI